MEQAQLKDWIIMQLYRQVLDLTDFPDYDDPSFGLYMDQVRAAYNREADEQSPHLPFKVTSDELENHFISGNPHAKKPVQTTEFRTEEERQQWEAAAKKMDGTLPLDPHPHFIETEELPSPILMKGKVVPLPDHRCIAEHPAFKLACQTRRPQFSDAEEDIRYCLKGSKYGVYSHFQVRKGDAGPTLLSVPLKAEFSEIGALRKMGFDFVNAIIIVKINADIIKNDPLWLEFQLDQLSEFFYEEGDLAPVFAFDDTQSSSMIDIQLVIPLF